MKWIKVLSVQLGLYLLLFILIPLADEQKIWAAEWLSKLNLINTVIYWLITFSYYLCPIIIGIVNELIDIGKIRYLIIGNTFLFLLVMLIYDGGNYYGIGNSDVSYGGGGFRVLYPNWFVALLVVGWFFIEELVAMLITKMIRHIVKRRRENKRRYI